MLVVPLELVCICRGRRGIKNKINRTAFDAFTEHSFVIDEIPVLECAIEERPSHFQIRGLPGRESGQIKDAMSGPASATVQVLTELLVPVADTLRMLFTGRTQLQAARLH